MASGRESIELEGMILCTYMIFLSCVDENSATDTCSKSSIFFSETEEDLIEEPILVIRLKFPTDPTSL